MKKTQPLLLLLCSFAFFGLSYSFAQAPAGMSYQSVIRDASNTLLANQAVGMRISLLQGNANGSVVYSETHTPVTNANGLVSIEIGSGTVIAGNFDSIVWAAGPYFIKTETDPTGGNNYSLTSTQQLLSVPYALYANNGIIGVSLTGDTLKLGNGNHLIIPGISAANLTSNSLYPAGTIFCSGTPTAIVEVMNPTTGRIWMDRNLGASQVAISSLDINAYGDLYQWGRNGDGHQCRNSTTTEIPSSTNQPMHNQFIISASLTTADWRFPQNPNLWQGLNGINNPCPQNFRIPTSSELDNERLSWSSQGSIGAFNSPLKLTLTGYRISGSGTFDNINLSGYYWSSTTNFGLSSYLDFGSSGYALININDRGNGYSVRCIKD